MTKLSLYQSKKLTGSLIPHSYTLGWQWEQAHVRVRTKWNGSRAWSEIVYASNKSICVKASDFSENHLEMMGCFKWGLARCGLRREILELQNVLKGWEIAPGMDLLGGVWQLNPSNLWVEINWTPLNATRQHGNSLLFIATISTPIQSKLTHLVTECIRLQVFKACTPTSSGWPLICIRKNVDRDNGHRIIVWQSRPLESVTIYHIITLKNYMGLAAWDSWMPLLWQTGKCKSTWQYDNTSQWYALGWDQQHCPQHNFVTPCVTWTEFLNPGVATHRQFTEGVRPETIQFIIYSL